MSNSSARQHGLETSAIGENDELAHAGYRLAAVLCGDMIVDFQRDAAGRRSMRVRCFRRQRVHAIVGEMNGAEQIRGRGGARLPIDTPEQRARIDCNLGRGYHAPMRGRIARFQLKEHIAIRHMPAWQRQSRHPNRQRDAGTRQAARSSS